MLRINLWSGPRNVSTAVMYAFRQRHDTRVVDEPLYGPYLHRTGAPHPSLAGLLEVLPDDAATVTRDVILGECDRPVLLLKQMAHHVCGVDTSFMHACRNVLLIRDPAEVLASIVAQIPEPTLDDIGVRQQLHIHEELRAAGETAPVLDARPLLVDPEGVLRELCAVLDLAWDPAMLTWPAGPKPEDGPWAPHWYENVHASTGFGPYRPTRKPVPAPLAGVLAEAKPYYEALAPLAITGDAA